MKNNSAVIIQTQWKQCCSNPEYKICQNIMRKEFYDLKKEREDEEEYDNMCKACYLGVCDIH